MNAISAIEKVDALAKLREPFPPHQISKLPKETRPQIDARKADKNLMVWKCPVCGGAHHKNAVHLDYVGHAAATDRLLDADPRWTWEPVADAAAMGLPVVPGGMWIKLTVDGVSRYGFGSADGKTGGDAIKEVIGDAIRNAGMRFGMALDLWHKGDLHGEDDDTPSTPEPGQKPLDVINEGELTKLTSLLEATNSNVKAFCEHFKIRAVKDLPAGAYRKALSQLERKLRDMPAKEPEPAAEFSEITDDDLPY